MAVRRWLDRTARRAGRGLAAGAAGTAAITLSSTAEMRVRGRPPSRTPLQVAERLLGVRAGDDGRRLAAIAHSATGVGVGALGAAAANGSRGGYFALSMLPELVVVPALADVEAPWRWGVGELAISVAHHAVYAWAAAASYEYLARTEDSPDATLGPQGRRRE